MQPPTSAVRVGSDATNQVEMRKISAEGIGDLVTFVVASHALREQNDPRKALALLSQMRVTPDSQYFKALARAGMREDSAAARELAVALSLDPAHAPSLALLGDIDIRASRWAEAIAHVSAAKATARPFTSTEGTAFDGKVYFKETYTNFFGKAMDTANLLAVDPATGVVVERYRLGGIPRTFETTDDALVIRYDIGRSDQPQLETVRFSKGTFDPPQQLTGHPLVRLNSIRPSWMASSNFLWAAGLRAEKTPKPTFSLDPDPKQRNASLPMTLPDLRAALEKQIAHDPTYPGSYVYLGLTLWELGDHAAAERAWTTAFSDSFPSTPYYDYSWFIRHLEAYGHPRWADRAYEQARKRRAALRDPVSTSLQIERMIDTPFVRAAGYASRHGGDPLREHLWLERTRALGGVALDGEELAAGAWARWFRGRGDLKAAQREEAVARRASRVSAYFDWLGVVDLAFAAFLAFATIAIVLLVVSVFRAVRRGKQRAFRAVIARITSGERLAIYACVAMVLLVVIVNLIAFRKFALYGLMPHTLGDSLGAALTAVSLDEALDANPSEELVYATAVSHHLAGHGSRATALYQRIANHDGVSDNVDALRVNKPPEHIPAAEDVIRAITSMHASLLVEDLFAAFLAEEDRNTIETRIRTASKIFIGAALALLLLIALFSRIGAADRTRAFPAIAWPLGAALLLFAAIAWGVHVTASAKAKDRSVPGFVTAEAMAELAVIFPLPPMPTVDATERAAWSHSTAMRTFRVVVFGSALAGAVLVILGAARRRRQE
jgi:tetratricopeptide (TPR) repeat protein